MITYLLLIVTALLVIYIIKTNRLSDKIKSLEREFKNVTQYVTMDDVKTSSASQQLVDQKKMKVVEPQKKKDNTIKQLFSPGKKQTVKAINPSRTREEWEALIGGQLLNRIGAIALILAAGFFLKHAFDNNWINETIRVIIGVIVGFSLLLLGYRFKKKGLTIFAQGLVGAAISILYLSVYASYNFYKLLPLEVVFILMSIVTIISFYQAIHYNAIAVSLLGLIGGFLTPLLLSTDQPNEIGLFIYLILLNIGIIGVVLKKDIWWILEPLALFSTYMVFSQWYKIYYTPENLLSVFLFLTIIWIIFYTSDLYRILKRISAYSAIRTSIAVSNGLIYYTLIYLVINPEYPDWMGLITLLFAISYISTYLLIRKLIPDNKAVHIQYSLSGIILIIAATTIQFEGWTTVIFWSLETILLIWYGSRLKLAYLWQTALGMYALAIFKFLLTESTFSFTPIENFTLLFNLRTLTVIVLSVTAFANIHFLKYLNDKNIKSIKIILQYLAAGLLFLFCTLETIDYFRLLSLNETSELIKYYISLRFITLAVVWILYSLIFIRLGLSKKILPFIYVGFFVLFISLSEAIIRSLIQYTPIQDFSLLTNFRAIATIFIITGSFINLLWLRKNQELYSWIPQAYLVLQISIVLLTFSLFTGETKDFFNSALYLLKQEQGSFQRMDQINLMLNLKQLALSGVWLLYSIFLMTVGILRQKHVLRISSIVLFGITILKIFVYDHSFLDTFYRIFSFFGLGLILLAVSYFYNRYKNIIFNQSLNKPTQIKILK